MIAIVTIFTIAHSFTLVGSAFGLAPSGAWFPPFVETAIAASIVYMALERGEELWKVPWPRPTLAGTAITAFWIAGILVAAGVIALAARKLRLAPLTTQTRPVKRWRVNEAPS